MAFIIITFVFWVMYYFLRDYIGRLFLPFSLSLSSYYTAAAAAIMCILALFDGQKKKRARKWNDS